MYTLFNRYMPRVTYVRALHCTFEHVGGVCTTPRVKYNVVKYSRCGVLYSVQGNTLVDRSKYQRGQTVPVHSYHSYELVVSR